MSIRGRGGPIRLPIRVRGGPIRAGLASECDPRPDYGDEDGYNRAEGKANVEGDRFHAGECSTVSAEYLWHVTAEASGGRVWTDKAERCVPSRRG